MVATATNLPDAAWYRALWLDERVASSSPRQEDADLERAKARLDRWSTTLGHGADELLDARLHDAGIDRDELHLLLGETDEALRDRIEAAGARPAWVDRLEALVATTSDERAVDALLEREDILWLVQPLLTAAVDGLPTGPDVLDVEVLLHDLAAPLLERLRSMLERTIAVEVQAARLRDELEGAASDERFVDFVASLRRTEVRRRVLTEVPLLARRAVEFVDQWVVATSELVERIGLDHAALEAAFGPLGLVRGASGADSDPHRGGRHVWFVDFESGTRLVYKPRPCAIDVAFAEFVDQVGALDGAPTLRTPRCVDLGTHGWMEFVQAGDCSDEGELVHFHERIGAWLAVLHVLGAHDVHLENLVASGEHPVLVDLETVLRSHVAPAETGSSADDAARRAFGESILATDLAPMPRWDARSGRVVDSSGMGGGFADAGEIPLTRIVATGTDEMRVGVELGFVDAKANRATLHGQPVDARRFASHVEDGLRRTWLAIAAARAALLGPGSTVFGHLADARIRTVLRPTRHYAMLQHELGHPQVARDALEADRVLTDLWRAAMSQPWRRQLVGSELAQLRAGDIPYFATSPRTHLLDGADGSSFPGAIDRRGIDVVQERVERLDDDLDRQAWVLRATLGARRWDEQLPGLPLTGPTPIELATSIAEHLERAACRATDGRAASWLAVHTLGRPSDGSDAYSVDLVGVDAYDGLAGIARYFDRMHAATGDARWASLAAGSLATLHERLDAAAGGGVRGIGAFDGWGGLLDSWSVLAGSEWADDALLARADDAVERIAAQVAHDRLLDVVAGSAGAVATLLGHARRHDRPRAREVAVSCGEHLLTHARDPAGLPFRRGFSHGPAGVAWAFALLFDATKEERFADAARAWCEDERVLLEQGWTDDEHADAPGMSAWCHGAVGIALARSDSARLLGGDEDLARDALVALEHELACDALPNDSLCHGALGNLLQLELVARRMVGHASLDDVLARRRTEVVERLHDRGAICALPRSTWTPGLMTGLAGIGYGLLWLERPDATPPVLLPGS